MGTSTKSLTFTAPQVTADSTYTVSVTVSDGSLTATASTTVTVTDGTTNQAPTVTRAGDGIGGGRRIPHHHRHGFGPRRRYAYL